MLSDLKSRGLIHDSTDQDALAEFLGTEESAVYCGFDPTADSLHIGHLLPIVTLMRFAEAGVKVFALVGGATGMIGDPSGCSSERQFLSNEDLDHNRDAIASQLSIFFDFEKNSLVDNRDWTANVSMIDFLRDVGKHVSVNTMLTRDSVSSRMETSGISFTEFSYMLLQANDFLHLAENEGCFLQLGGSDQWGNIVTGIDLIRRRLQKPAHGLTVNLLTKSNGEKFGKTSEGESVWLDPSKTLPFELHQFFLRVSDDIVETLLKSLTFLSIADIHNLMVRHAEDPSARIPHLALANSVCTLVHGQEATDASNLARQVLFSREVPDQKDLKSISKFVPFCTVTQTEVDSGESIVDFFVKSGLCESRGQFRRVMKQNGVRVNGSVPSSLCAAELFDGKFAVISKGKTSCLLITE